MGRTRAGACRQRGWGWQMGQACAGSSLCFEESRRRRHQWVTPGDCGLRGRVVGGGRLRVSLNQFRSVPAQGRLEQRPRTGLCHGTAQAWVSLDHVLEGLKSALQETQLPCPVTAGPLAPVPWPGPSCPLLLLCVALGPQSSAAASGLSRL